MSYIAGSQVAYLHVILDFNALNSPNILWLTLNKKYSCLIEKIKYWNRNRRHNSRISRKHFINELLYDTSKSAIKISDLINQPRKPWRLLNRNYLLWHQTNMTVSLTHPTEGRAAKKIWTTQLGLLNPIIIPERYSCRHADALYGLDNDSTCLKCCSRRVIVSLDLHFGDNCLLGSRNWPSLVDGLYGEESAEEMALFSSSIPDLTAMAWSG